MKKNCSFPFGMITKANNTCVSGFICLFWPKSDAYSLDATRTVSLTCKTSKLELPAKRWFVGVRFLASLLSHVRCSVPISAGHLNKFLRRCSLVKAAIYLLDIEGGQKASGPFCTAHDKLRSPTDPNVRLQSTGGLPALQHFIMRRHTNNY